VEVKRLIKSKNIFICFAKNGHTDVTG